MEATGDVDMNTVVETKSVVKRDGSKQPFDKTKILERIKSLTEGLNEEYITYEEVVEKVSNGVYDGKYTAQIAVTDFNL